MLCRPLAAAGAPVLICPALMPTAIGNGYIFRFTGRWDMTVV
jgi:hypothetical protein